MVAHRQKKGLADVPSGGKKRDAILFLPVAVFDEGHAEAGRNQPVGLRDHAPAFVADHESGRIDRKSTRLNSSHTVISYAVFCLKKKKKKNKPHAQSRR